MSVPLSQLLASTSVLATDVDPQMRVESLSYDSRQVKPGALFFALRGTKAEGTQFVAQAAELGAIAIVSDAASSACALPHIQVPQARIAMAEMACAFHGQPADALKVMGVTGTNGKTTTAFLVKHLLDADQKRCGLLGTVKYCIGDEEFDAPRTTPESADLQDLLAQMVATGSKAVALEVSSHALAQNRVHGIGFDTAVFTNLTQDHLDYHKSMDAYFDAKASLFEGLRSGTKKKARAIINVDDRYGRFLCDRLARKVPVLTYGRGPECNFRATDLKFDAAGTSFHLTGKGRSYLVRTPLIGVFNVYNALAALTAVSAMGMELRAAVAALAKAPQVPGRLERVPAKRSFQVYVDYAHTDDALRNVLRTLSELNPARVLTVFGCGGDRDAAKRPLMAAAAEEFSDWCFVTSDNPRSEDPQRILADIEKGFRHKRHEQIVDRAAAIHRAVERAEPGDIVLIAGKGHETTQESAMGKTPFDDVVVARRAIEAKFVEVEEE